MDQFEKRAQNVVNTVLALGKDSVQQVATILKSVHQDAIEQVAQDYLGKAAKLASQEVHDEDKHRFYMSQAQHVRSLKNTNPNL
jgi:hypothetical protein